MDMVSQRLDQHPEDYLLYWALAKDDMPNIFENTPTCGIVERCIMQPLQSTDIKLQRSFVNLVSRDSKLSTAWSAYHVWYVVIAKDMLPRIRDCVFGSSVLIVVLFAEGLDLVRTAWNGDTTKIGIAIALHELCSQR
jgi:hypothetical protein